MVSAAINCTRLRLSEIKDQVLLLLFTGHETLTFAIAPLCKLLAQHPEVLAAARAQQRQLAHEQLSFEQLTKMTYLG